MLPAAASGILPIGAVDNLRHLAQNRLFAAAGDQQERFRLNPVLAGPPSRSAFAVAIAPLLKTRAALEAEPQPSSARFAGAQGASKKAASVDVKSILPSSTASFSGLLRPKALFLAAKQLGCDVGRAHYREDLSQ